MKRKVIFLLILSAIITNSYAETVTSDADEVVIDLNENTLTSDNGVKVTNGTMSALFYKLKRDPATGEMFFSDNALINIDQPTGNIKIETEKGNVSQKNEKGEFYNSFAYMNVAKTTGAEAPNDRVFFGSPYIKYENENIYAKDAWVTTDFKIVNFPKEPSKAGYHLLSSDMFIEPDKQITLKNTNLYIKGTDITPFNFPWFRANIRKDSKVPLFVTIQSSDDYGTATSMGVLYGNRGDKFRGGISPKFADKMGWLIGRWENWYKTDTMGETRVNIDDLLLISKAKKNSENRLEISDYEKKHKRYKVEVSHKYNGENGSFDFTSQNSTRSMVSSLSDVMEKYDNNNVYKSLKMDRYKFDKNIGFYNLNANLYNLGEAKDLSFSGKMNLVSDKKAYGLIVYDKVDDISFDSSIDHDLYTNLAMKKDNDKYTLTTSYDYLHDLDPGSTSNDLMSKNERIKADLIHKENGASISFDKRNGDDFRRFSLWEEDINTTTKHKNVLGIDVNYTPTTIAKYELNNFENITASLGNYKAGNYIFTPTVSYKALNRKLDTVRDNYRSVILGDNRTAEYNRFENIISEDSLERRADLNLKNDNEIYRVAIGKTDSEVLSREGLFDDSYKDYVNKSKFYEVELGRQNIELGNFGKLGLDGTFREDKYNASSDKSNSINLKMNNDLFLYKSQDLNVTNKFKAEFQKYSFSGEKNNEERRLYTKKNYIKLDNSVDIETKNVNTTYDIGYKETKNPYGLKNKSGEEFSTGLKFKFDNDNKLSLNYKNNKRFTDKTRSQKNINDFSEKNYSFDYETKKHELGFSNTDIEFKADDFTTTTDFKENINEHRIKYAYKFDNSKLTTSYAQGSDKLKTEDDKYLNRKNREYTVLYNIYGDVEKDFYGSYKTYRYGNSRSEDEIRNTDVYRFSFDYRDKRFEEEELMKYATLEYEKPNEQVTSEDIANIRSVLDRRQEYNRNFMFTKISDESFILGNYKKTFNGYVKLEKNNLRYSKTGNLKDSLSKFEGGLTYSYNRLGVGYKFTEKSSWKKRTGDYTWSKDTRQHELSAFAKVGKPSEGWRVKTYAMFYDNFNDQDKAKNRKNSLDSIGIEIGKEMGFYEWAISYENRYKVSSRDYEWRAGIHFTLLTFPNNSLFGAGAKNGGGTSSTKPDGYLLDKPSQLKNSY